MRVVVAGGTGFVGRHLVRALAARGDEATVLTRAPGRPHTGLDPKARLAGWDDPAPLAKADAVVVLSGETIAQRWTRAAKERIVESRVGSLQRIGAALRASGARPGVVVSASAIGYYGPHGAEPLDEEAPPGDDFLARTCIAWEEAARALEPLAGRVAVLRFGFVLGKDGGALPKMLLPFRAGLGAPAGSGSQVVSFVHVEDLARLLLFALDTAGARGAFNATAPEPVTMDEFARALRRALHRVTLVPPLLAKLATSAALPLLLGEAAALVLDGQRVLPARAKALGFSFGFPTIDAALGELLA